MRTFFFSILMVALATASASAATLDRVLKLKDGSTVQGRVIGLDKGVFTIQTTALGELRIKEDDVVSLTAPKAPPAEGLGDVEEMRKQGDAGMEAMQAKIMADPDIMAQVQEIASDPEIAGIMSDPLFMKAAQNKDSVALQANPRTLQLMQNPKVKALLEKLQAANAAK
ncbi:MAG: hypothetical protein WCO69_02985 [Candidatus Omnitrophota bacterium]